MRGFRGFVGRRVSSVFLLALAGCLGASVGVVGVGEWGWCVEVGGAGRVCWGDEERGGLKRKGAGDQSRDLRVLGIRLG